MQIRKNITHNFSRISKFIQRSSATQQYRLCTDSACPWWIPSVDYQLFWIGIRI